MQDRDRGIIIVQQRALAYHWTCPVTDTSLRTLAMELPAHDSIFGYYFCDRLLPVASLRQLACMCMLSMHMLLASLQCAGVVL